MGFLSYNECISFAKEGKIYIFSASLLVVEIETKAEVTEIISGKCIVVYKSAILYAISVCVFITVSINIA